MHDLWEDSDSPIANEQKPRRFHRSPTEAAILPALREWLLRDYTMPYCRSLAATRIFRRCYWVDALGGSPGTRGTLTQALQQVNNTSQALASEDGDRKSQPLTLQGLLLAQVRGVQRSRKGKEHPQVEETTVPFTLPRASAIVEADWLTPALLEALEQYASIFLLNFFPPTTSSPSKREIPFLTQDELAPYSSRTTPTEVCLLISRTQVAHRMLPSLRAKATASAFTALLRSDRWKAQLAHENEAE